MAGAAAQEMERPAAPAVARAAGSVLDRLFAPHGPAAYFRWLDPGATRRGTAVDDVGTAGEARSDHDRTGDRPAPGPSERTNIGARTVTFERSGLMAVAEGSLLETAEAAGLAPRNRCRRGICGTCTTPKLSGTVVDVRTGETSDGAGPIRICVSHAEGDVALDL